MREAHAEDGESSFPKLPTADLEMHNKSVALSYQWDIYQWDIGNVSRLHGNCKKEEAYCYFKKYWEAAPRE
jgi:hypothetical protein